MAAYATRGDVYRFGLPRGTLGMPARTCDVARTASDLFELDGHGFEDGDELLLRALEGGSLPSPLVQSGTYFALRVSDSTFKVSATKGGAAIDLTGADGASIAVATPLPFDEVLELYSRWVDGFIPHAVPLTGTIPVIIVAVVARLAAKELQRIAGITSESMLEAQQEASEQLKRWAAGVPVRDANVSASTNQAVTSTVVTAGDPRGWGSGTIP